MCSIAYRPPFPQPIFLAASPVLFYVPYVTLAVMTFPSILHTTSSPIAGLAALVLGIAAAWLGANLFQVAVGCCAIVLILEFFLV